MSNDERANEIFKGGESRFKIFAKHTEILREQIEEREGTYCNKHPSKIAVAKYIAKNFLDSAWNEVLSAFIHNKEDINEIMDMAEGMSFKSVLDLVGGMAVVPLTNTNGHNYQLGETFVIVGIHGKSSERATSAGGWLGNTLPVNHGSLRAATNEEIVKFVAMQIIEIMQAEHLKLLDSPIETINYIDALCERLKGGQND